MATAQSANGMPLSIGDMVRIPNSASTSLTSNEGSVIGMVTAVNAGANTISVFYMYMSSGTPTTATLTGIQASTALQLASASGPANAESNRAQ